MCYKKPVKIEGGKIDHAHHASKGQHAVHEFYMFDEALGAALNKTNKEETLTVTTADHSHTMSIVKYSNIEIKILKCFKFSK